MDARPILSAAGSDRVRGYRPQLDVVRFLAFFLVFIHHSFPPIVLNPKTTLSNGGLEGMRVLLSLHESCAMGVCLFFTLSAYLITGNLLTEREANGAVSVSKFYVRRALRIWPLYSFGIAIGIGIALLLHQRSDVHAFVWFLLFAGNFYCAAFGWLHNPMNPLWSISIEEQFYLVWPWAMRWLSRRALLGCALLFIAVANCVLFILGQHHAEVDTTVGANTLVQFEMFATGIILALAGKHIAWKNSLLGCILALTGPVFWFASFYRFHSTQPSEAGLAINGPSLMIGYGLIALGCAAILHGFCMMDPSRMPQWAIYLGKISYGLYVFHVLGIEFAHACFGSMSGWSYVAISTLLALVLTIAAAIISYALLESPFLRLKRRFEVVHTKPI